MKSKPISKFKFGPVSSVVFLMALCLILLPGTAFTSPVAKDTGKSSLKTCAECHDELVAGFGKTVHGMVKKDCSDCHGYSQKHVETGEYDRLLMTTFKKKNSIHNYEKCLNCHAKSVPGFARSEHAAAGMDCTNCHSIHKKDHAKSGHSSKLCASCHQDIYAQFNLNEHHRLKEGILECTSCHNPHEKSSVTNLGGFKDVTCEKCHMDKVGPFIYEHMPVKTEGCTYCHETHGSPNRHMLKHQSVRELCFSCHSVAPQWHTRFLSSDTNCANCHSAIHGSNLDPLFLK